MFPNKSVTVATRWIRASAESETSDTTPVIRGTFACTFPTEIIPTTIADKKRFFQIIDHHRRQHLWIGSDHSYTDDEE